MQSVAQIASTTGRLLKLLGNAAIGVTIYQLHGKRPAQLTQNGNLLQIQCIVFGNSVTKNGDGIIGSIEYSGGVIPLIKFKVSPSTPKKKTTPSAAVLKASSLVKFNRQKNVFVAQMKSGHIGIMERQKGTVSPTTGKEKLKELLSPAVPQMVGNEKDTSGMLLADFRKTALGPVIFLGVVVAGNPPRGVVAGHGKLGLLLLDDEVDQVGLARELVAQPHAIVIDTETEVHQTARGGLAHLQQ